MCEKSNKKNFSISEIQDELNLPSKAMSCINFSQNMSIQLKDYISGQNSKENKNKQTSDILDDQMKVNQTQKQWGFPRPCPQFREDQIIQELYSNIVFMGSTQKNQTIFQQIAEVAEVVQNHQQEHSRNIQKDDQIQQENLPEQQLQSNQQQSSYANEEQNYNPRVSSRGRNMLSEQARRVRNETKNIIKNYAKEIIKYVLDYQEAIENVLIAMNSKFTYQAINQKLQARKNRIKNVGQFKAFLLDREIGEEVIQISKYFMRNYCVYWIYNSRIQDTRSHLKYKARIEEFLDNPEGIQRLKY